MAPHSSILAWRIPWKEEPAGYSPWGHKETQLSRVLIDGFTLFYPDILDYHNRFNTAIKSLSSPNHSVSILF